MTSVRISEEAPQIASLARWLFAVGLSCFLVGAVMLLLVFANLRHVSLGLGWGGSSLAVILMTFGVQGVLFGAMTYLWRRRT